jgi:uncharacterized protein YbjT (DUF2867 family)
MILVLGGKGKTGSRVAERLADRGEEVRIGSRTENPPFDWENRQTWPEAIDGADSVYITFQPDLAVPGAREAIEGFTSLAVSGGVGKVVLLSGKGEKEAELCEQVVRDAGADWTIVRASWFNQNFSEHFFLDPILAGHVALPKAEALVPFVDTNDIADVVVQALLNDDHIGKTYELTGPRLLTFEQAIREISAATGREIAFSPITLDDYESMLMELQVPENFIWLISYLFREVLVEGNSVVTDDIQSILGRRPRDFSEYARETAESGVWNPVERLEQRA